MEVVLKCRQNKNISNPPPYILVPHSFSGIETLYWAQTYPEEIKAICGLDPAVPEYQEVAKLRLWFIRVIAKLGGITSDMANEAVCAKENAALVKSAPFPKSIPTYFFISDGKFAHAANVKNWTALLIENVKKFENGKHMLLDCGHDVHAQKPKEIATEIKKFIATV